MSDAPQRDERHPAGLYVLFSAEMWERFSFYSVQAMLVLYLRDKVHGFAWSFEESQGLYANYVMCVYFSPLLGGWLADRVLGNRRSVMIGGLFFMAGHLLLAFHHLFALYAGLVCLVAGNGLFKPNVSTLVGHLYPEGSRLKDAAYSLFYMGINLGALLAPIAAEIVRGRFGFHPAFAMAAGGMVVSVAILSLFKAALAGADRGPGSAPAAEAAGPPLPIDAVPDSVRVAALVVVFAVGVVFWMLFWQNGSTLTDWADRYTDWSAIEAWTGWRVTGIASNAINPGFIVLLGPVFAALWVALGRRGSEPSTPAKMAAGLFFAAASAGVMWLAARAGGHDVVEPSPDAPALAKVSPLWLVGSYVCISAGEILLSAMGLSLVSKVAPKRWRALLMGGWFVSISLGGKLSGVVGQYWERWPHTDFFALLGLSCLGAGLLLFVLLRFLRRAMPGV